MTSNDVLNPILAEEPVSFLSSGQAGAPGTGRSAVVYLSGTDPHGDPARPPTLRDRLRRSYWRYHVDMAHHWTSLSLALPAKEEAFSFRVWVSLTWQVRDPVAVARTGVRDLRPVVWGLLDHQLRTISRLYGIEQAGEAEEDMSRLLDQKLADLHYGVRLGLVSVNVRLDEAAERYLAGRVESRRARAQAGDDHDLETLRRRHSAELAVMKGDLERAQLAHAAEMQRLRDDQEAQAAIAELALKRQRLEFYQHALRSGEYGVVMLHLMEHPEDVQTVITMLQAGRQEEYDRARAVLDGLLDRNLINAAEAEPLREHAVERLRSAFDLRPRSMTVSKEIAEEVVAKKNTETLSAKVDFT